MHIQILVIKKKNCVSFAKIMHFQIFVYMIQKYFLYKSLSTDFFVTSVMGIHKLSIYLHYTCDEGIRGQALKKKQAVDTPF